MLKELKTPKDFYYSYKQEKILEERNKKDNKSKYGSRLVLIGNIYKEYTCCVDQGKDHGCKFDDIQFVGVSNLANTKNR